MVTNDDKTPLDRPQLKKEAAIVLEHIRSDCHGVSAPHRRRDKSWVTVYFPEFPRVCALSSYHF